VSRRAGRLVRPGARTAGWTLLLTVSLVMAGAAPAAGGDADDATGRMLARVRTLTAPPLAGRGSGTPGLAAAADSVAAWLAEIGLRPGFGDAWQQEVPLRGEGWAGQDLTGRRDRNVAGLWPGRGALADRILVVGAHLDHLGRVAPAGADADPPGPDDYYPGANDNASGVAVVLEIAARLAADSGPDPRRSLLFVFFGGEEVGLQGSARFVTAPPVPLERIDAMINFDTVGRMTDRRLYVSGLGTTPAFGELAVAANADGLDLSLGQGGWSGSDHMSFNTREVPVLFVFGGPYAEYNRPADTWERLDPASLAAVADYGTRLAGAVAAWPESLPWVMVTSGGLREDEQGEGNRATWFGSLPDFTEDAAGYKLAGVFDDSPAARAGLQKGDLMVRMAGEEIVDLAGFTRVLRAHAPGDLVEVEIRRDGKPLRFTVVLGDRADRR
jgi:hypothetical protein